LHDNDEDTKVPARTIMDACERLYPAQRRGQTESVVEIVRYLTRRGGFYPVELCGMLTGSQETENNRLLALIIKNLGDRTWSNLHRKGFDERKNLKEDVKSLLAGAILRHARGQLSEKHPLYSAALTGEYALFLSLEQGLQFRRAELSAQLGGKTAVIDGIICAYISQYGIRKLTPRRRGTRAGMIASIDGTISSLSMLMIPKKEKLERAASQLHQNKQEYIARVLNSSRPLTLLSECSREDVRVIYDEAAQAKRNLISRLGSGLCAYQHIRVLQTLTLAHIFDPALEFFPVEALKQHYLLAAGGTL